MNKDIYEFVRIVEETFFLDADTIEEARKIVEDGLFDSPDMKELDSKIIWKRAKCKN